MGRGHGAWGMGDGARGMVRGRAPSSSAARYVLGRGADSREELHRRKAPLKCGRHVRARRERLAAAAAATHPVGAPSVLESGEGEQRHARNAFSHHLWPKERREHLHTMQRAGGGGRGWGGLQEGGQAGEGASHARGVCVRSSRSARAGAPVHARVPVRDTLMPSTSHGVCCAPPPIARRAHTWPMTWRRSLASSAPQRRAPPTARRTAPLPAPRRSDPYGSRSR